MKTLSNNKLASGVAVVLVAVCFQGSAMAQHGHHVGGHVGGWVHHAPVAVAHHIHHAPAVVHHVAHVHHVVHPVVVRRPVVLASPVVVARPAVIVSAGVPANPDSSLMEVTITNPSNTGKSLAFMIRGVSTSLQPGESRTMQFSDAPVVVFDRGPGFGIARMQLEAGQYTFTATDAGWTLEAQS